MVNLRLVGSGQRFISPRFLFILVLFFIFLASLPAFSFAGGFFRDFDSFVSPFFLIDRCSRPSSAVSQEFYLQTAGVLMASKVPKFGSWENGDVGYTACFEVARKGNPGGPIINPNDIQMNRDVSQSTAPPNHNKPKPKQQQQRQQLQQPKFGAWDKGDEVPYTQFFENKGKANPNEPQMNRDVGPSQQSKPPPKQHQHQQQQQQQPKFGAWDGGDEVPYTQFFENKGKPNPNDQPQMNRDVGPTRQPGKAHPKANNVPQPKPQVVKFVGGASEKPQQTPPAPRAPNGRGASVPVFGGWNDNPAQAGGYTVVFDKLHEDKNKVNVPNIDNPPRCNTNPPNYPINQPKQQGGCFSWLFG